MAFAAAPIPGPQQECTGVVLHNCSPETPEPLARPFSICPAQPAAELETHPIQGLFQSTISSGPLFSKSCCFATREQIKRKQNLVDRHS